MKTILAVEDSDLVLKMLSSLLKAKGFQVIEAHNAVEALTSLESWPVDLVLTDLIMPGMNGVELAREIRRRTSQMIPVLVQTTISDDRVKREGLEAGVSGWILKPFQAEELTAQIRRLIDS
ncbi:response regulator [Geomonas silvestris]|uniref:Response regulator n=1 Tax=Geomonas silvestris TaxID=2740184 RepID=A0A6V8MG44_9BACT|nr:response regulator [Geomonas silvestris]GFO58659.1 response regulator [Geomonas silvestris]